MLRKLTYDPASGRMLLPVKLLIGGLALLVFGLLFGWAIFPPFLRSQVHSKVNLKEGSDVRALWSKFPFFLEFRVYLFNVTNPDEIKKGEKPIVKQVGPYFFEEWQEKTDLVDREEDDSVEYSLKNKFIFRPDMSEGLTGEEELVLPHVFMLVLVMATLREKPSMVPVINKAVNSIFKNPDNVFVKVKAMDMMFRGLPIDCDVQDFAGGAVCSLLKESPDALHDRGPNQFAFSLFGVKNDTSTKWRMRVLRGIKKLKDIGVVTEFNGKTNMSTWNDDYCDTFNGTDGSVFHPFFYETEDVVTFAPDLCRSLSTNYEKKTKVDTLTTNRYTAFLGDPNTMPEQKCYCPAPDNCYKKGVMDLFKCAGAPLIASHPHFYLADEEYLSMVDGLSPSKEEHEIFLDFEPFTGSPLSARKRLQFNIMIHKVDKFKIMKNFPEALLPLFWVEEGVVMPDNLMKDVKSAHKLLTIVAVMKWLLVSAGSMIIGVGGFLYFRFLQMVREMMKIQKEKAAKGQIGPMDMLAAHVALQAAQAPARVD